MRSLANGAEDVADVATAQRLKHAELAVQHGAWNAARLMAYA